MRSSETSLTLSSKPRAQRGPADHDLKTTATVSGVLLETSEEGVNDLSCVLQQALWARYDWKADYPGQRPARGVRPGKAQMRGCF